MYARLPATTSSNGSSTTPAHASLRTRTWWATTLHDELVDLGFEQSCPTLTRQIPERGLRPACETCRPAKARPVAVIEHPPGEDTQWDWVELPDPPPSWGSGRSAYLFVGGLAHSGKWRAVQVADPFHVVKLAKSRSICLFCDSGPCGRTDDAIT